MKKDLIKGYISFNRGPYPRLDMHVNFPFLSSYKVDIQQIEQLKNKIYNLFKRRGWMINDINPNSSNRKY